MTKGHNDRIISNGEDKGYSVRVGKTLPVNSANLAYISTPKVEPKSNLQITDLSTNIKENGLPSVYQHEKMMFPDEDFLLRTLTGESIIPSKAVSITDEFSVPQSTQEVPVPLYFKARIKGLFDARGAMVAPYQGGYYEEPAGNAMDYSRLSAEDKEKLIYFGNKIKITKLDGTPVQTSMKYKVELVETEGEDIPKNAYSIYLYTNFRGTPEDTYVVRYEKYNQDGSHVSDYTEVLNAYPFFSEIRKSELDVLSAAPKENGEWKTELTEKVFAITEDENRGQRLYAPAQVMVANHNTRPAHQFRYRVGGKLKAKLSAANKGTIKIGMAFLNNSIPNVEDLTGTLKKLYEDGFKPPYLDFENPYPLQKSFIKENPRYWMIDLYMPSEQWSEYDLIILSGYGFYDMTSYSDSIRSYIENGGKIWIDNAGETGKVLTFRDSDGKQTFFSNVQFSNTLNAEGFKAAGGNTDATSIMNRLYSIGNSELSLGYNENGTSVNPQIEFGSGESPDEWNPIVRYSSNQPSVMKRVLGGKGSLFISNCGIFRSLFHGNDEDMKFAINMILLAVEEKWIQGPWQQEYVYHRDNLFKEEYRGVTGGTAYVDERNDYDEGQIVAKKMLSPSTRRALSPYVPSMYYNATGRFEIETESNSDVILTNSSVEIGTFDEEKKEAITEWTTTQAEVIPGWDTIQQAGASVLFRHIDAASQRGSKAIALDSPETAIGSHAYWRNKTLNLAGGSYRASVWLKTENVRTAGASGANIGAYTLEGSKISVGTPVIGTRDWTRVDVNFNIDSAREVELRVGFVDGNGVGTIICDAISLSSIGSVYMTPANDGNRALYAYAVRPRGESFDLKAGGFNAADITVYDPAIEVTFAIRSFVYYWDNNLGRQVKKYGNSITDKRTVRRSDGVVTLGILSTMLPPLQAGAEWADKNDVYYEVQLGGSNGVDPSSQFVNLDIYDTDTGKYYYNRDGLTVIKHVDLFYNEENRSILLQARTNYYTVRATKRRYGVLVQPEKRIELAHPSTIDNRDCWFLRVRNGAFTKEELSYLDIKSLMSNQQRYGQIEQRVFGTHTYALPEYARQVFKPSVGYKRIREELAEYVNDRTIRVQDAPLYVQEGVSEKERLVQVDSYGMVFKAINSEWSRKDIPSIYVDENMNGEEVQWFDGFEIDFTNGLVIFSMPITGHVYGDYKYGNLEVWKRSYKNNRIREEEATPADSRTFMSKNANWLRYPAPIVKVVAYDGSQENIVPVTSYTIDYLAGVVTFKENVAERVVLDYTCCEDKPLRIRDYDAQNGCIYLEEDISFKDELYVNYYYEEEFLEYRGYYSEEVGAFIHLDLNPSEGHYSTLPVIRTDEKLGVKFTSWEQVPSAKLMNKEVYVYIVPYKNSFGEINEHVIRHCYSAGEWDIIQKTNPAALLLGTIHMRENASVHDAVVLDARTRGGGLKKSITRNQMKKTEPSSRDYWDMSTWDGAAYYQNGVVVIEVPKRITDAEGGPFTEEEIREIVKRHIAFGVYFILEFV